MVISAFLDLSVLFSHCPILPQLCAISLICTNVGIVPRSNSHWGLLPCYHYEKLWLLEEFFFSWISLKPRIEITSREIWNYIWITVWYASDATIAMCIVQTRNHKEQALFLVGTSKAHENCNVVWGRLFNVM